MWCSHLIPYSIDLRKKSSCLL